MTDREYVAQLAQQVEGGEDLLGRLRAIDDNADEAWMKAKQALEAMQTQSKLCDDALTFMRDMQKK